VSGVTILLIAMLVLIIWLATDGGSPRKNTASSSTTTTTPVPATGIGLRTVTWTDTNPDAGLVVNPLSGGSAGPRTLITDIWYPSMSRSKSAAAPGAKPDYRGGPFPVVVFAHGFDTLPSTYMPLLDSWVRAGFVVVAPLFPDENANEISSLGNVTVTQREVAESDVVYEPYDIAYVVGKVEAAAAGVASTGAGWLKGLAEPGRVALAGHSDGAEAVAALVYSNKYASTYETMAPKPFAVIILSGSTLTGTYGPPASAPPALFVQSAVDECNLPQNASALLHDIGGGFFLKLAQAGHFSPYVGQGAAAPVVEEVTITFLKEALTGTPSYSVLSASITSSGIATLYPPATPPALTALTPPSQAGLLEACAVPGT
jgi:hypothetical protein